jgi:hypothetical protein
VRRPSRQSFGLSLAASSGPIVKAPGSAGGTTRPAACFVFYGKISRAAFWIFATLLCRSYGASGEEIISIGADVNRATEAPCHSSASRMTLADP